MDVPTNPEISVEVPPYLRVHKDGTVERLAGTQVAPAGHDSDTDVLSKDILIIPETGVTGRLYRPNSTPQTAKLPLVLYFHGGAFCISSAADPLYHNSLNRLVAEANVVALSVNYRLAPEHPLPTAYHDSWAAIQWVAAHGRDHEDWLRVNADFERVFLAGDSAGANLGHYMALKMDNVKGFGLKGFVMVNPYFWGKEAIGVEVSDDERRKMVDKWWGFVCPSDKGNDDPLINPFVEEAPSVEGVACHKVLVVVAENDILRERGKLYHKMLTNSAWKGNAQFYETLGEDHVFHIFNPHCDKAKTLLNRIAHFINQH
ncbi:probable carboxylesterase 2 [Cajanus cajan]|uniref:Gibberellin receptor GID1L1 n=1 Tax=Cajanus cajan TaxID=3821 RepID=A0A151TBV8_CAJCA|nr:probable carboxylesterase 2 [Cajanus cajan]KYP64528.1 putative gibberellin receptor GID1L1 [Cajanus cajan]